MVVFAGDGQLISPWGGDLEGSDLPPTMIVGTHRVDDEMQRLHEYSPDFEPARFAAHEQFFVDDVGGWVRSRFGISLPADRTAVLGVSASGELALAMGIRHPDLYGVVFCASPGGGYRPLDPMPGRLPRTYLFAGRSEPFFHENASRWATALLAGGGDVVMTTRNGRHGDGFWRRELPRMVAWAFRG
jgi:enterochelin esterase-like enzyme